MRARVLASPQTFSFAKSQQNLLPFRPSSVRLSSVRPSVNVNCAQSPLSFGSILLTEEDSEEAEAERREGHTMNTTPSPPEEPTFLRNSLTGTVAHVHTTLNNIT